MEQRTRGWGRAGLALAAMSLLWTPTVWAQTQEEQSLVSSVMRAVVRDPATYAPSLTKYSAMNLDWESSQIFFRHGFVERNARFTVSGRSADTAISHGAGSRKIVVDSLMLLVQTVPENFAERALERVLIRRYPQHRKMLIVTGHVGRFLGTSYLSYSASMGHFRQWQRNERLARQMGYK
jgi:hypothetical protein